MTVSGFDRPVDVRKLHLRCFDGSDASFRVNPCVCHGHGCRPQLDPHLLRTSPFGALLGTAARYLLGVITRAAW
jgi:hypothetical protein